MLQVFFGTDSGKARAAALAAARESGLSLERIEAESFQSGQLRDVVESVSLFGAPSAYILDMPSDNDDFSAELFSILSELPHSPHAFFVIEGLLLADQKKKYQKQTESLEEFKRGDVERFNTFALADALCTRDKKNGWLLLARARAAGLTPEEIIGALWWQLKLMLLAGKTSSAQEAGVNAFPYNKAKKALSHFAPGRVEELAESLLALYHQGHAGEVELDLALEQWVLEW